MDAEELKDLVRHVVELSRIGLARYYDKAAVIFIAPRDMRESLGKILGIQAKYFSEMLNELDRKIVSEVANPGGSGWAYEFGSHVDSVVYDQVDFVWKPKPSDWKEVSAAFAWAFGETDETPECVQKIIEDSEGMLRAMYEDDLYQEREWGDDD